METNKVVMFGNIPYRLSFQWGKPGVHKSKKNISGCYSTCITSRKNVNQQ